MGNASLPRGSGPGVQTPDGCSVALYRATPYRGELEPVLPHFGEASTVLELGCGTGRMTAALIAAGHTVTVVDESAAMLAEVTLPVAKVCSPIGALALERRFDVVLAASALLNSVDAGFRRGLLEAADRHLAVGGSFFAERMPNEFLVQTEPGQTTSRDDIQTTVESVVRRPGVAAIGLRYDTPFGVFLHEFEAAVLEDQDVLRLVAASPLRFASWLGEDKRWLHATRTG